MLSNDDATTVLRLLYLDNIRSTRGVATFVPEVFFNCQMCIYQVVRVSSGGGGVGKQWEVVMVHLEERCR